MSEKVTGKNGLDDGGFNWSAGEQETAKYLRPATLPENANDDAGRYIKSADELVDIKPVKRLGSIEVRKPKKSEWFRAHTTMVAEISVIKRESTGDFYAIDPELIPELAEGEVREAYLSACISDEARCFFGRSLSQKAMVREFSFMKTIWLI